MNKRISTFDYIKGLMIFIIILTHINFLPQERLDLLFPFYIDMAVPVFMIISGYLSSLSLSKRNCESAYSLDYLIKRALRFTVPLIIAIFIEYAAKITPFVNIKSAIVFIIKGGIGPGTYYYPIMMQFILFFPILYLIIKNNHWGGFIFCGLINLVFEVWCVIYKIDPEIYRVCILRYTFVIACGIFFYFEEKNFKKNLKTFIILLLSGVIGFAYIFITSYTQYRERIFVNWTTTSMMTTFWIFPLFFILYKALGKLPPSKLQVIGKASYHIFLTQMVYYCTIIPYRISSAVPSVWIFAAINIIICVAFGCVFYYFEYFITSRIISYTQKQFKKISGSSK